MKFWPQGPQGPQDLQDHLQDLQDHLQDLQKPTRKLQESYKKLQKSTKIYKNPRIPRESLGNRPNSTQLTCFGIRPNEKYSDT